MIDPATPVRIVELVDSEFVGIRLNPAFGITGRAGDTYIGGRLWRRVIDVNGQVVELNYGRGVVIERQRDIKRTDDTGRREVSIGIANLSILQKYSVFTIVKRTPGAAARVDAVGCNSGWAVGDIVHGDKLGVVTPQIAWRNDSDVQIVHVKGSDGDVIGIRDLELEGSAFDRDVVWRGGRFRTCLIDRVCHHLRHDDVSELPRRVFAYGKEAVGSD